MINNNLKIAKDVWSDFAAKQFANSIATIKPKIKFSDEQVQREWEIVEKNNNLLKINYTLLYLTSKNSCLFLGLKQLNNKPILVLAESSFYEYDFNKLVKLSCQIITKNQILYESYNLENSKLVSKIVGNENEVEQEFFKTKNIPYSIFYANPLEQKDLEQVPNVFFNDYWTHLDLLLTDSYVAKGLTYLNTPQMIGTTDNINALKKALIDPKCVVYENTNIFSMLQQGGVQIQQGVSNFVALLEKLRFYETKIKQFGFMKKETSDLGTKNLQSAETELLNSDSDDYIELKANLFEIQWENFLINVFFDYLKNIKCLNLDYDQITIDVEISGSTKFLQNRANQYIQNQQGVLTNPNDLNSNNFKQENNEQESEGS